MSVLPLIRCRIEVPDPRTNDACADKGSGAASKMHHAGAGKILVIRNQMKRQCVSII